MDFTGRSNFPPQLKGFRIAAYNDALIGACYAIGVQNCLHHKVYDMPSALELVLLLIDEIWRLRLP